MAEFTVEPRRQTAAGLFSPYLNPGDYCYEYSSLELTSSARPAKLNQRQLPLLCRQLAAMLTAGVPLSRALEVSAGSARDKTLKVTLAGLRESIHKGRTLSEAMEYFPSCWFI